MDQKELQKSVSNTNKTTTAKKSVNLSVATMLLILFVSTSSGFLGGWVGSNNKSFSGNSSQNIEQGRQVAEVQSNLISSIAKDVGPSVVSIDVTSQGTVSDGFFGTQSVQQQSAGTGFIISDDGYVVTNRHVIPQSTKNVSLTMSDGTILDDVTVVGRTTENDPLDVAFLKINNTNVKLQSVKIGDSSKIQVGDTVIAIGNALGQFQNSVTSGILSGYGRNVSASDGSGGGSESLQNLFQTDAAINQGNSGGPLVNSGGQVIGINTAVAGGDAQNIGFAIPINDAKGLIDGILANGKLQRPYLGVQYVQLNQQTAKELEISQTEGAYISNSNGQGVVKDSPADKAGLKPKDIIIKINDEKVDRNNTLSSVIGRFKVGENVTITYIRGGETKTTQATIDELPSN
jgi:serine protease Do